MQSSWPGDAELIILDGIHKYKKWKSLVKGEYDKLKDKYSFLITGSDTLFDFFVFFSIFYDLKLLVFAGFFNGANMGASFVRHPQITLVTFLCPLLLLNFVALPFGAQLKLASNDFSMLSNFTTSNFFRYCQKRAKRIDAAIL
jgi:hypothetical protein